MLRTFIASTCFAAALWCCGQIEGQETGKLEAVSDQPKVKPLLRPEMKQLLDSLKNRQPRLPLPPATEGQNTVNNGRARAYYLPESWTGGPRPNSSSNAGDRGAAPAAGNANRTNRNADPQMTLDNTFKVRLFWIVSRVNNCHYCLGHQELKLTRAGMAEDEIARLDTDWTSFPVNEQAAFAFTKKLTLTPHLIGDSDLAELKKHFNDNQIIEIVQTVAGFNSTNRWTDALGIPQDQAFGGEHAELLTPTSAEFTNRESTVVVRNEPQRPKWESSDEVAAQLQACRERQPRVRLGETSQLEPALQETAQALGVENYAAALAIFPTIAARQLQMLAGIVREGRSSNQLKAMIFWAVARENRGWYLLGHAQRWLAAEGIEPGLMFAWESQGLPETRHQLAVAFARKLTTHSREITDRDIAELREHYSDHEVAEIVYLVCFANAFSHLAESLQLPLETTK